MLEWLLASMDSSRIHSISDAVSWHGRLMVLTWGVVVPFSIVCARFFKITPRQNWPQKLDNPTWWAIHWIGQSLAMALTLIAIFLVFSGFQTHTHARLGYAVVCCVITQIILGVFRGSKGGPTARHANGSLNGDHYDMTRWRRLFEHLHKTLGYTTLLLSAPTVLYGLWMVNAPRFLFLAFNALWLGWVIAFIYLQRCGWAVDTYQAIWGPDTSHPGNQRKKPGWGMNRPNRIKKD